MIDKNNSQIRRLDEARESINLLHNMLKAEKAKVEKEIELAAEAKQNIVGVLFDLTGDDFYRKQGGSL
jgi:DNA replication initiation complex subunit (GINS family)